MPDVLTFPILTPENAGAALKSQHGGEHVPRAVVTDDPATITAAALLDNFVAHLIARRRSPETIRVRLCYIRQLEKHVDLVSATVDDLERLLAAHPEWSAETANAAISSWRVFYKWALRRGLVTTDPTIDLERPIVIREVGVLADDETLAERVKEAKPRDVAILLLGREAGLRRTEIASLRVDHRSGDWLTVKGKGGRIRRLRLSPTLTTLLESLEVPDRPYYFEGFGRPHMSPSAVYAIVKRNIGTSTHSLRRSAITAVYRGGGNDLRLAQIFAGHAKSDTTAGYVHVPASQLSLASEYASITARLGEE